jgi:hypothetical protein
MMMMMIRPRSFFQSLEILRTRFHHLGGAPSRRVVGHVGMNQMSRNSGSGSPSTKSTSKTTLSSHLMPPAARFARRDETANVFLVENDHPANGPQKRCRWQQNSIDSNSFLVKEGLLATMLCTRICAKLTTLRMCSHCPLQVDETGSGVSIGFRTQRSADVASSVSNRSWTQARGLGINHSPHGRLHDGPIRNSHQQVERLQRPQEVACQYLDQGP